MNKYNNELFQNLLNLKESLKKKEDLVLGYPGNKAFDYSILSPFLSLTLNNIGDPYEGSNYPINTFSYEKEVVEYFSRLLYLPLNEGWGYITNGGTMGNLHGVLLGRERFPDAIVYYSAESHYSIEKILMILDRRDQSVRVPALPNGEMDYEALENSLKQNSNKGAIFFLNIGTTMKGAIDNIDKIRFVIQKHGIKDSYIHCDGALSGMILPFIQDAPPFDFRANIDSISISGHKFLGSPIPNGIFLCKKKDAQIISRSVEYIKSSDNTITGSRCSLSSLILWYATHAYSIGFFKKMVDESLAASELAIQMFRERDIDAWKNPYSITVVFPTPVEQVLNKWKLATQGNISHLICYPQIVKLLPEFMNDYIALKKGE